MSYWPKELRVRADDADQHGNELAAELLRQAADYIERLENQTNSLQNVALRSLFVEYLLSWDHRACGTSYESYANEFMREAAKLLAGKSGEKE